MTVASGGRRFFNRYGPTIAVIATLAVLVLALPDNRPLVTEDGATVSDARGPVGGDGSSEPTGTPEDDADTSSDGRAGSSGTAAAAPEGAGGSGAIASGPPAGDAAGSGAVDCRPGDGRQPGITAYMPPCVPVFSGDNGGATARGVLADHVVIALWMPAQNMAQSALLSGFGVDTTGNNQTAQIAAMKDYYNHHYETYGREVRFVRVEASGDATNDEAMRADAIRIAEEIGAFAAIGGTAPPVLVQELAARGVFCICGLSEARGFYERAHGWVFGFLAELEQHYVHLAEYAGRRLVGHNAVHAGEPLLTQQRRKFGLVWTETGVTGGPIDAGRKKMTDFFQEEFRRYGGALAKSIGYAVDYSRVQQNATNIIVQLKDAGVTSVLVMSDPITLVFITREATRQQYFPEWVIGGFILTDSTLAGRLQDQAQWRRAFGISPLPVFWTDFAYSPGYREYHHIRPGAAAGEEGNAINSVRQPFETLFIGIHMAGPQLTPESFRQGMYNYPRSGGVPSAYLGYFTESLPNHTKDFVEIWYDATGAGRDELGADGVGIMRKVAGGRRYEAGTWPGSPPNVFTTEGTVTTENAVLHPHEDDGHTHDLSRPCRSCAPQ